MKFSRAAAEDFQRRADVHADIKQAAEVIEAGAECAGGSSEVQFGMFNPEADGDGDPPAPQAAVRIFQGLELEIFKRDPRTLQKQRPKAGWRAAVGAAIPDGEFIRVGRIQVSVCVRPGGGQKLNLNFPGIEQRRFIVRIAVAEVESECVTFEVFDCGQHSVTNSAAGHSEFRCGIEDTCRIQRSVTGRLECDVEVAAAIEQRGIDAIDD